MIREATYSDARMIAEIYNYYILNSIITFELDPITPEEIINRMERYKEAGPYLVYEENDEIIGYAYVSKFRERQAYEHSVESTIYLKNGFGGKGLGSRLYSELLAQVPINCHVIIGGIALPNDASVKLHE
jgi:L-amino acid N-acyltransferase YncA